MRDVVLGKIYFLLVRQYAILNSRLARGCIVHIAVLKLICAAVAWTGAHQDQAYGNRNTET